MTDERDELGTTIRLVDAAKAGDERALDDLLARYLPRIRQIVAIRTGRRLKDLVGVDDLVQEALMRILRGLKRFEHRSEASFRSWLARCVESAIVDEARRVGRERRGRDRERRFSDYDTSLLQSCLFGNDKSTPSAHARATELAERLEQALLELPLHQRELITLRAICGMSYREIGVELGISDEANLRVAYSRALRRLEERVGA